ncbi:hypothetical protein [Paraburkholderia sp. BL21I4N1]|uniref:hypothetical protein n=1 Tax=Paraburkholderia sp. BL21I4N1 TaxID=1938801 RepID=UPI0035BE2974
MKTDGPPIAKARATYLLELARGCSYVDSTLSPDTGDRAIAEIISEFRELYGDQELAIFRKLLAENLRRRGKQDAASAVVNFKLAGQLR